MAPGHCVHALVCSLSLWLFEPPTPRDAAEALEDRNEHATVLSPWGGKRFPTMGRMGEMAEHIDNSTQLVTHPAPRLLPGTLGVVPEVPRCAARPSTTRAPPKTVRHAAFRAALSESKAHTVVRTKRAAIISFI